MFTRGLDDNQTGPEPVDRRVHDVQEMTEAAMGPNVSPSKLARYWGVHVNTVYRDIAKGALRGYRLPGGQIRIRTSDARRYGRPIE
jgi:excisionase family DNA binding protein